MLRLPGPDDELPPLVTPATATAVAKPVEVEDEEDDYDDSDADEAMTAARSDRTFVAILVLASVVLVGGVTWWLLPEKKPAGAVAGQPDATAPAGGATSGTGTGTDSKSGSGTGSTPGKGADGGGATAAPAKTLLVEIESVVKAFLQAPDREASLALVLDPADAARKWDVWLAGEPYVAPGFSGLAGDPVTTGDGEGAITRAGVRGSDYKLREINLIRRGGQLKVDWDSWVAWSEMRWEDFRRKKPVEPVLFRVQLSAADYFNFDFRDEGQWSCFRLDSADGVEFLYGYLPRGAELDQRLRPTLFGAKPNWVVKLKFPEGATRDNQVLIDSIVAEGWLVEEGK